MVILNLSGHGEEGCHVGKRGSVGTLEKNLPGEAAPPASPLEQRTARALAPQPVSHPC